VNYRHVARRLAGVSLANVYDLAREPWKIQRLTSPSPVPVAEAIRFLCPDVTMAGLDAYRLEFLSNHRFFDEINRKMVGIRRRRVGFAPWKELLYVVVRILKPAVVVETGVFDGESTAVILQAMLDGGTGELVSIDLPAVDTIVGSTHAMEDGRLPAGQHPGWVIPDYLRGRLQLRLGDSRALLPEVFARHPVVDVFFHDSLHTYDHQLLEYRAAWPHLREGGVLLSDDITWSAAFHRFCRQQGRRYVCTGEGTFGAVRK
jgi:hypothetical protein